MEFRRSGQRDNRRRRVLNESRLGSAASKNRRRRDDHDLSNEALFARRSENYGDAEFMDEQPRITDLVPMRYSSYLLMFVVAVGIIAALEGLYMAMPKMAAMTTDGRVASFDLDGEGSLAVWFSSMTLAAGAVAALLVYTVRRHRRDDYHGRYRVWIWAAAALTIMSLDETASLHEGFKEMMTWLTGNRVFGDGSVWWIAAYFFLLGGIGTRLLADMRECRLSTVHLLAGAACYAVAVAAQLEFILPEKGAQAVMAEEGAEMLGNVFVFLALLMHARHVICDAEGLLPEQEESPEDEEVEYEYEYVEETVDDGWEPLEEEEIVVHPPHGKRRPKRSGKSRRSSHPDPIVSQLVSPVSRKLTKQEKKALRRKLEKARRQREGR